MIPLDEILEHWRVRAGGILPAPESIGQLDNLNQVPQTVVAAARGMFARGIDERLLVRFISLYLRDVTETDASWFVRAVVQGTDEPETWAVGGTLVPNWTWQDQVTLDRDVLLAPLGSKLEYRLVETLSFWTMGLSWVGAPCTPQPSSTYQTPVPTGACRLLGQKTLTRIGDPTVAARRWIAARIAFATKNSLGADFRHAAEVAGQRVPVSLWSEDAKIALEALVRESREFGLITDTTPGFRGPDEWFK